MTHETNTPAGTKNGARPGRQNHLRDVARRPVIPGYVFAHGRRESHNGGPAQVGPTLTPIQYRRLKRADQRGLQLSVAGWRHRN